MLQSSGEAVKDITTGYLGKGVYLHSLSNFVECFVQILDNDLRKKYKAIQDLQKELSTDQPNG